MWTEASRDADLVKETVNDTRAKALLFQACVNLELFNHASGHIHEALDQLNFHNFARAFGSCHMDEGIFGADIHGAQMLSYTQRVTGFLLATVTAGHRFTRSILGARARDRGRDWSEIRKEIDGLEKTYVRVRNFLEHLDKALAARRPTLDIDCSFTPEAILTCREGSDTFTFNFTKEALARPQALYDRLLQVVKSRKHAADRSEAPGLCNCRSARVRLR